MPNLPLLARASHSRANARTKAHPRRDGRAACGVWVPSGRYAGASLSGDAPDAIAEGHARDEARRREVIERLGVLSVPLERAHPPARVARRPTGSRPPPWSAAP